MTSTPQLYLAARDIPGGRLTYLVRDGVVVGSSFRGELDVLERAPVLDVDVADIARDPANDPVGDVLESYARGELHALESVVVSQPGGDFQQRAWAAMRTIRAGSIDTYAGLARRAGNPRAYRAAGTVCSSNLVAPFVPCHRVVAAQGLGGYGYGLDVKLALLAHEGVHP